MKIKTYKGILAKVHDAIGRGTVVQHTPTETNALGQSGYHTLADDIMNVMAAEESEGRKYRALAGFLQSLGEFSKKDSSEFCVRCLTVGGDCNCEARRLEDEKAQKEKSEYEKACQRLKEMTDEELLFCWECLSKTEWEEGSTNYGMTRLEWEELVYSELSTKRGLSALGKPKHQQAGWEKAIERGR